MQLVVAANRAMLELLVDLILVTYREPSEGIDKLEAWERSAKFKFASLSVKYVRERRGELSDIEQPLADFVEREETNVADLRQKYWPDKRGNGMHPDRWTGQTLSMDVRESDLLRGGDLEWFYQTEYRRMNLQLHGSTLAGYRGLDFGGLGTLFALAHKKAVDFGLETIQISLGQLGIFDESARAAFGRAQEEVLFTLAGVMAPNATPPVAG